MTLQRLTVFKHPIRTTRTAIVLLQMLVAIPSGQAQSPDFDLESSYRFLVSDRDTADGILYTATAGKLKGLQLPLSFAGSAEYWGEYVCRLPGNSCTVTDVYDPQTYSLTPQKSLAGELQTERVNSHNGINIYDAATWQIGVMLGHVLNGFSLPNDLDAYTLVSNQNQLLKEGYNGNSSNLSIRENRAVTVAGIFVYNQQIVTHPEQAYVFRMLPRSWLSSDPLMATPYADQISTRGLLLPNGEYQTGKVTWTDWKPITGENAWALLLGPLQAAYIHYVIGRKSSFVPLHDPAIQNALAVLPTFAAMQSPSGGIYYAPTGTAGNQVGQVVDPYEMSVENTISLYAGLTILRSTLEATLAHENTLGADDTTAITDTVELISAMINGGTIGDNRTSLGLLSFFRDYAWRNGEFVQGGRADDPTSTMKWIPNLQPKAVDVNTWGISALGSQQIDAWFGFGASYHDWQKVKQWGGYGIGTTLWGVGFSDQDGNGIDASGNYRQGILSTEWTAGAITMLRTMIAEYRTIPPESPHYLEAQRFVKKLALDEQSMMAAIGKMRIDTYGTVDFPGQPQNILRLLSPRQTRPYIYASKRYFIPFGWYANPIPSTCATAWIVMIMNGYNPFVYGGEY